jgi:hypothetical protein
MLATLPLTTRVRLLQNLPGYVRAPASRDYHPGALGKKAEGVQLKQNDARAVDP